MKLKKLIKNLNKLVKENPEAADYEVAQQDCFSAPLAFTGTNPYIGHYYETESSGYLDKDDVDDDEEITEDYPVVVIESF